MPPRKGLFKSDGFRGVVLPILFFAALAWGVWGICLFLWNLAEGDSNSAMTKIMAAEARSRAASKRKAQAPPTAPDDSSAETDR
jgi:hypothetical protein